MIERRSLEQRVDEALRAVAEEDARLGTSARVEARLVEHVRARASVRRRRARLGMLAAAATIATAVAVPMWRSPARNGARQPIPAREVTTEFMPLAYSAVPFGNGHIVRMQVPRASLASFGLLPADDVDATNGATVTADVVVGDDGLARAVRFVRRLQEPSQHPVESQH